MFIAITGRLQTVASNIIRPRWLAQVFPPSPGPGKFGKPGTSPSLGIGFQGLWRKLLPQSEELCYALADISYLGPGAGLAQQRLGITLLSLDSLPL